MKLKDMFLDFTSNLRSSIIRFASASVISVLFFAITSYSIFGNANEFLDGCLWSLGCGFVFSVFFVILAERFKLSRLLFNLLCVLPMAVCFVITKLSSPYNAYFQMGYWGVFISLICLALWLMYTENNSDVLTPHLLKSGIFSALTCGILTAGVMICLAAIQLLIYEFDFEIYFVAAVFIWTVLFTNMFLSYIPQRDDEISLPKLFKTLVLYVALPVYLLLMAILLVYLLKIIVTFNMPVGQINWFASFASLFFVFFAFCVRQYRDENKPAAIFTKYIGFIIIPIIIMQLIAVYVRISAYGFTTPRIISLILIGISIIFAMVSIFRKQLEHVLPVMACVILVFTLVPGINIIELPKQSQANILKTYLLKNNMLTDGKITPNKDVSPEDKERILSAYTYLKYSAAGKLPDFVENTDGDLQSVLGFSAHELDTGFVSCNYSSGLTSAVDISEYSSIVEIDRYHRSASEPVFDFTVGDITYTYNVYGLAKQLYDEYGAYSQDLGIIQLDENVSIIIENLSTDFVNDFKTLDYFSISGYVLIK